MVIKTNTFYKLGTSIIKVIKINTRVDNSTSINLYWYHSGTKVYVEDLTVSLLTKIKELDNFKLIEALYD